jgi:predicted ribosomally synthesized peptide with nif11-like leader
MSVADLKAYGKMCATDPALAKKAKAIGLSNIKGQAEHAKTLGLTFDERDMEALAKELHPKGELSEKELSTVAGGVVTGVAAAVVGAATVGVGVVGGGVYAASGW